MVNYFDISKKHIITAAHRNIMTAPRLHPNRKLIEHDFIYVLEGEWIIGQDDEVFHIRKDDVLILAANHAHYGIEPCTAGMRTMYIHALYHAGDALDTGDGDNKIVMSSHIKTNGDLEVKKCFEKIIYAYSIGNCNMASAYFDALLCELETCENKTVQHSAAEELRQMIVTSSRILKNNEIAEEFHMSVKSAEQIFKSAFHTTIHRYMMDCKIDQVKFFLVNFPNMKLREIAINLGFCDEFHLSRQFKKIVGESPGEYRKKNRK